MMSPDIFLRVIMEVQGGHRRTGFLSLLIIPLLADRSCAHAAEASSNVSELWMPENLVLSAPSISAAAGGGAPAAASVGYDDHKPRTPPPDLPSLLLDSRITYLGMPVWFELLYNNSPGLFHEVCYLIV